MALNASSAELALLQQIAERIVKTRQEIETYKLVINDNQNAFFLTFMGLIIFFMQCGFAFLEAGAVRAKNVTNILTKNVLDSLITAIGYTCIGWALAYGPNNDASVSWLFGYSQFFGFGIVNYAGFFFQYVFAARASTIISGAVAERAEFFTFFVYSIVVSAFVYPVLSHWGWSEQGWLKRGVQMGDSIQTTYLDLAGSGVVHLCGGTIAFVAALLMGPRIGRFPPKAKKINRENGSFRKIVPMQEIPKIEGHSVPLAAFGGFILMAGFLAFNGGSIADITQPGNGQIVAKAMINTLLAGAFAALTCLGAHYARNGKWTVLLTMNGCLAGMIAACAGCNQMNGWGALITGFGAGLVFLALSKLMIKLRIDDPLDAFAVHAGGGFWGLISVCLVSTSHGGLINVIFSLGGWAALLQALAQLLWNLVAAFSIILWSAAIMAPIFFILKLCRLFRVPAIIEEKGIDIYKHGEEGYPLVAYGHGWDELGDSAETLYKDEVDRPANSNPNGFSSKNNSEEEWNPTCVIYHDPSKYQQNDKY